MSKNIAWVIVGVLIVGGISFYAGMTYGGSQQSASSSAVRGTGYFSRSGRGANGGIAAGQVIAKDATSVTLALPNGAGSKIVLVSPTVSVAKTVSGSLSDVAVGVTVVANGTPNSDGSITAQSIQIRPADAPPFNGGTAGQQGTPPPGNGN